MDKSGYIYVLINPSMDGIVKIGKTQRHPEERVAELSSATGVPTTFYLVFHEHFMDCDQAESYVHTRLENNRIADNREFFRVSSQIAITTILEAKEKICKLEKPTVSEVEESSSPDNLVDKYHQRAQKILELGKPPQDIGETREWLNKAAQQGLFDDIQESSSSENPGRGLYKLAFNALLGFGDSLQDVGEAINLFTKAAQLGCNNAYLTLGNIYRDGSYVNQDFKKAKEYYTKGIDHGDERCWAELSEIFVEEEHFENWGKCWNHYFQSKFFKENFCDEYTLDGSNNSQYGFNYVNWLSSWYKIKKKIKRDELLEWLLPIKNQMKSDNGFKEEMISSFERAYALKPPIVGGTNRMVFEIIQKQNKFDRDYWEWILKVLK